MKIFLKISSVYKGFICKWYLLIRDIFLGHPIYAFSFIFNPSYIVAQLAPSVVT